MHANVFVERPPGTYRAVVWMSGTTLFVNLTPTVGPAVNDLPATPRLA